LLNRIGIHSISCAKYFNLILFVIVIFTLGEPGGIYIKFYSTGIYLCNIECSLRAKGKQQRFETLINEEELFKSGFKQYIATTLLKRLLADFPEETEKALKYL